MTYLWYRSGEFWLFQARAVDKGIYWNLRTHWPYPHSLYYASLCSKVLGFRPMSKVKSSQERDFVRCVQRLGWKIWKQHPLHLVRTSRTSSRLILHRVDTITPAKWSVPVCECSRTTIAEKLLTSTPLHIWNPLKRRSGMPKVRYSNKAVEDLTSIWEYTFSEWYWSQADEYYEMLFISVHHL